MHTGLKAPDGHGSALTEDEQLGVVLVRSGVITVNQLGNALGRASERHCNLARVLVEEGFLTEERFVATVAGHLGLEFVDLGTYPVDPAAAQLISEGFARRYLALPIGWRDGALVVAMADPANVFALDDIRQLTGADVAPVVATAGAITTAICKYQASHPGPERIAADPPYRGPAEDPLASSARQARRDAGIASLVNVIISRAMAERASDIYIEPTGQDSRASYRIDGVVHEATVMPAHIHDELISAIKAMAGINVAEGRLAQDGQATTTIEGHRLDLGVATRPTVHGEAIVMSFIKGEGPGPAPNQASS